MLYCATKGFAVAATAVVNITGWFDGNDFNGDQMGQLYYYHGMIESSPAADRQWLLAGPWDHAGTWSPKQKFGERDFGRAAFTTWPKSSD